MAEDSDERQSREIQKAFYHRPRFYWCVAAIWLIVSVLYLFGRTYGWFWNGYVVDNDLLGTYGDFFGGVFGAVFGLISILIEMFQEFR